MGTGNTTSPEPASDDERRRPHRLPHHALMFVIAHSRREPDRVGEVAAFDGPGPWTVGRATDEGDVSPFVRQQPGESRITGALSSKAISRGQLRIMRNANAFELVNVGTQPMLVNRVKRMSAIITPGDVIEIGNEYVLCVTKRIAALPRARLVGWAHIFGEADINGIVGESPAAWTLRAELAFAARAQCHVLILGDTGTGKELCARAIHSLSQRIHRAFIARSGGTLSIELVIAELFGNVRNYPNPGMPECIGLIAEADGGTLFLDEIARLPPQAQASLLRVLDAGEYHRLGETKARRSSAVVVAAMNGELSALLHDLAPRFPIVLRTPTINQRREDIPLIVRSRVLELAKTRRDYERFVDRTSDRPHVRIEGALIAAMLRRSYTSNVRELDSLVSQAASYSPDDKLMLPPDLDATVAADETDPAATESLSREATIALLEKHRWHVQRAADAAGVSRFIMGRWIKKHGLQMK